MVAHICRLPSSHSTVAWVLSMRPQSGYSIKSLQNLHSWTLTKTRSFCGSQWLQCVKLPTYCQTVTQLFMAVECPAISASNHLNCKNFWSHCVHDYLSYVFCMHYSKSSLLKRKMIFRVLQLSTISPSWKQLLQHTTLRRRENEWK